MAESPNNRISATDAAKGRRSPVWLRALFSQIIGVLGGFAAYVGWLQYSVDGVPVGPFTLIAGMTAAVAGRALFRLPGWWLPINLLFPPGLYAGVAGQWPGWIFGALFVATVLVFWNVVRDRVPLYLSNRCTSDAIAALLQDLGPAATNGTDERHRVSPPPGRFCDLGSGTGGFVIRVGAACPSWQIVGYESSPVLWFLSVIRGSFRGRDRISFSRQNFWNQSLSTFDAVYAFLSPEPMTRLYEKAKQEMKPGSVFISNSFEVPGIEPDEIIQLEDQRRTRLLIWRWQPEPGADVTAT
ncbi:MAG: class I SAM-dependent methyltransferase [Rhodospirillales bacterium]